MGAAGLEIVKIWEDEDRESIIEVQALVKGRNQRLERAMEMNVFSFRILGSGLFYFVAIKYIHT